MNKKGFTLIELLAVIVILAVIAIIATPMILGVIEKARKGAAESSATGYLDAIEKQIMKNQLDVNANEITDGVYNLPMEGISIKGEVPSEGWVAIQKSKIKYYSMKVKDYVITTGGEATKGAEIAAKPIEGIDYTCKRATVLHTTECTNEDATQFCKGDGYTASGAQGTTTITYGNLGTSGVLTGGDAFDCDINNDGLYDSETERFYYLTDLNSNYAVLVYYNNTVAGVANNNKLNLLAYDSEGKSTQGPVTAIANLPTTTQWSTRLSKDTRAIIADDGATSIFGVALPTAFSYSGYAARLLTTQEMAAGCGKTVGAVKSLGLSTCNYLMENTTYSSSSIKSNGYWLESPAQYASNQAWFVSGRDSGIAARGTNDTSSYGVRPVIEVKKVEILY